jgi:hypothetical protein
MRKSWLFILLIALVLGFLAGTAGAGSVHLTGKHGRGEIEDACNKVGGTFITGGPGGFGDYGCTK